MAEAREMPAADVRAHHRPEIRAGEGDVRGGGDEDAFGILGQYLQTQVLTEAVDDVGAIARDHERAVGRDRDAVWHGAWQLDDDASGTGRAVRVDRVLDEHARRALEQVQL